MDAFSVCQPAVRSADFDHGTHPGQPQEIFDARHFRDRLLNGRALAGTGVWRSQLIDRQCPACRSALESEREKEQHALQRRGELIKLMGGEKPYREFTFDRYQVALGNQLAYERSKNFNPACDNLYLWGPCGVGKTHLAHALARNCFQESLSVLILWASQITRNVRMKDPDQLVVVQNKIQAHELVFNG